MLMLQWVLMGACALALSNGSSADYLDPYLLQTKSLPSDLNFMPSLSNGHLGYTVFGDAIFMNGIYNGASGRSKRARIPNWLNISAEICDKFGCLTDDDVAGSEVSYEMDLRNGYFRYRKEYTKLGLTLEQRSYPHRYYNRALVYELEAKRSARLSVPLFLRLRQQPGNNSDAFDFEEVNRKSRSGEDYRTLRGRTKILEFEPFQPEPHEIFVVFSESLEQDRQLEWPTWQASLQHRIIISIDRKEDVARKELQDLLQIEQHEMLRRHTQVWNEFWDNEFSIDIEGDPELSRIVNAGIFYLSSSLPSLTSNQANEPYYGLSPTGLARGNLEADYQGHNFWDTEIWMWPVAAQFHFDYGKILLDYRLRHLEAAKYNANVTGYEGARYPWESAYTGTEVTNPCCPDIAQQEIHISPDILFTLQKYFAQSNDIDWVCEKAWPIALEVAQFLVSRASCEESEDICHLRNVMGPDEDHADVDDNVYTNVVSKIALEFAEWAGGKCGNASSAEQTYLSWRALHDRLLILHDEELNYHPQHQGYKINATVKQADTILLGYPLQFDTSDSHLNDLHYYAKVTRESGPAMTWSMFAANYLGTGEPERAHEYFERGYKSYVRPEFKVWSENPIGYDGSANFLTGIGGFLQALIFGYGGLDFARVGDKSHMISRPALLPPNVERVTIKYIKFASSKCIFQFQNASSSFYCPELGGKRFELSQGNRKSQLNGSFNVTIKKGEPLLRISTL
ncbi:protein-glucosylgalactosylhydroxylysine glucosidase isoform X2 [Scaptodrosophila lebanonensis]|uniref:Protein-glucosylgalactosylhydroxylysine glucosidase isoform X2 n=1 Tax=Drosophila lebanonensis TaxID=7225 RepID=A0A6J2U6B3_DROLE|nr:protein-glucosylgalactosylhydroxylysine glucosidase isoform X2 [Scaptodrosophila lebanonensis]